MTSNTFVRKETASRVRLETSKGDSFSTVEVVHEEKIYARESTGEVLEMWPSFCVSKYESGGTMEEWMKRADVTRYLNSLRAETAQIVYEYRTGHQYKDWGYGTTPVNLLNRIEKWAFEDAKEDRIRKTHEREWVSFKEKKDALKQSLRKLCVLKTYFHAVGFDASGNVADDQLGLFYDHMGISYEKGIGLCEAFEYASDAYDVPTIVKHHYDEDPVEKAPTIGAKKTKAKKQKEREEKVKIRRIPKEFRDYYAREKTQSSRSVERGLLKTTLETLNVRLTTDKEMDKLLSWCLSNCFCLMIEKTLKYVKSILTLGMNDYEKFLKTYSGASTAEKGCETGKKPTWYGESHPRRGLRKAVDEILTSFGLYIVKNNFLVAQKEGKEAAEKLNEIIFKRFKKCSEDVAVDPLEAYLSCDERASEAILYHKKKWAYCPERSGSQLAGVCKKMSTLACALCERWFKISNADTAVSNKAFGTTLFRTPAEAKLVDPMSVCKKGTVSEVENPKGKRRSDYRETLSHDAICERNKMMFSDKMAVPVNNYLREGENWKTFSKLSLEILVKAKSVAVKTALTSCFLGSDGPSLDPTAHEIFPNDCFFDFKASCENRGYKKTDAPETYFYCGKAVACSRALALLVTDCDEGESDYASERRSIGSDAKIKSASASSVAAVSEEQQRILTAFSEGDYVGVIKARKSTSFGYEDYKVQAFLKNYGWFFKDLLTADEKSDRLDVLTNDGLDAFYVWGNELWHLLQRSKEFHSVCVSYAQDVQDDMIRSTVTESDALHLYDKSVEYVSSPEKAKDGSMGRDLSATNEVSFRQLFGFLDDFNVRGSDCLFGFCDYGNVASEGSTKVRFWKSKPARMRTMIERMEKDASLIFGTLAMETCLEEKKDVLKRKCEHYEGFGEAKDALESLMTVSKIASETIRTVCEEFEDFYVEWKENNDETDAKTGHVDYKKLNLEALCEVLGRSKAYLQLLYSAVYAYQAINMFYVIEGFGTPYKYRLYGPKRYSSTNAMKYELMCAKRLFGALYDDDFEGKLMGSYPDCFLMKDQKPGLLSFESRAVHDQRKLSRTDGLSFVSDDPFGWKVEYEVTEVTIKDGSFHVSEGGYMVMDFTQIYVECLVKAVRMCKYEELFLNALSSVKLAKYSKPIVFLSKTYVSSVGRPLVYDAGDVVIGADKEDEDRFSTFSSPDTVPEGDESVRTRLEWYDKTLASLRDAKKYEEVLVGTIVALWAIISTLNDVLLSSFANFASTERRREGRDRFFDVTRFLWKKISENGDGDLVSYWWNKEEGVDSLKFDCLKRWFVNPSSLEEWHAHRMRFQMDVAQPTANIGSDVLSFDEATYKMFLTFKIDGEERAAIEDADYVFLAGLYETGWTENVKVLMSAANEMPLYDGKSTPPPGEAEPTSYVASFFSVKERFIGRLSDISSDLKNNMTVIVEKFEELPRMANFGIFPPNYASSPAFLGSNMSSSSSPSSVVKRMKKKMVKKLHKKQRTVKIDERCYNYCFGTFVDIVLTTTKDLFCDDRRVQYMIEDDSSTDEGFREGIVNPEYKDEYKKRKIMGATIGHDVAKDGGGTRPEMEEDVERMAHLLAHRWSVLRGYHHPKHEMHLVPKQQQKEHAFLKDFITTESEKSAAELWKRYFLRNSEDGISRRTLFDSKMFKYLQYLNAGGIYAFEYDAEEEKFFVKPSLGEGGEEGEEEKNSGRIECTSDDFKFAGGFMSKLVRTSDADGELIEVTCVPNYDKYDEWSAMYLLGGVFVRTFDPGFVFSYGSMRETLDNRTYFDRRNGLRHEIENLSPDGSYGAYLWRCCKFYGWVETNLQWWLTTAYLQSPKEEPTPEKVPVKIMRFEDDEEQEEGEESAAVVEEEEIIVSETTTETESQDLEPEEEEEEEAMKTGGNMTDSMKDTSVYRYFNETKDNSYYYAPERRDERTMTAALTIDQKVTTTTTTSTTANKNETINLVTKSRAREDFYKSADYLVDTETLWKKFKAKRTVSAYPFLKDADFIRRGKIYGIANLSRSDAKEFLKSFVVLRNQAKASSFHLVTKGVYLEKVIFKLKGNRTASQEAEKKEEVKVGNKMAPLKSFVGCEMPITTATVCTLPRLKIVLSEEECDGTLGIHLLPEEKSDRRSFEEIKKRSIKKWRTVVKSVFGAESFEPWKDRLEAVLDAKYKEIKYFSSWIEETLRLLGCSGGGEVKHQTLCWFKREIMGFFDGLTLIVTPSEDAEAYEGGRYLHLIYLRGKRVEGTMMDGNEDGENAKAESDVRFLNDLRLYEKLNEIAERYGTGEGEGDLGDVQAFKKKLGELFLVTHALPTACCTTNNVRWEADPNDKDLLRTHYDPLKKEIERVLAVNASFGETKVNDMMFDDAFLNPDAFYDFVSYKDLLSEDDRGSFLTMGTAKGEWVTYPVSGAFKKFSKNWEEHGAEIDVYFGSKSLYDTLSALPSVSKNEETSTEGSVSESEYSTVDGELVSDAEEENDSEGEQLDDNDEDVTVVDVKKPKAGYSEEMILRGITLAEGLKKGNRILIKTRGSRLKALNSPPIWNLYKRDGDFLRRKAMYPLSVPVGTDFYGEERVDRISFGRLCQFYNFSMDDSAFQDERREGSQPYATKIVSGVIVIRQSFW
jgi:hypothetical protein